jgi:hypothetical protein
MLDGLVGNILTQAAEFVDQFVYGLYHSGFDVSLSDPHANRSRKPQKKKKKHCMRILYGLEKSSRSVPSIVTRPGTVSPCDSAIFKKSETEGSVRTNGLRRNREMEKPSVGYGAQ